MHIHVDDKCRLLKYELDKEMNNMKMILGLYLCVLLVSCSAISGEQEVNVSATPANVTEKSLFLEPSKPLRTRNPFNFLLVAVPPAYKLESNGWTLLAPSGDRIKVEAILTSTNGTKTRFDHVGFMYGDGKQYLSLSADPNEKLKDEYVKVQVTSSQPFRSEGIRWLSTAKY